MNAELARARCWLEIDLDVVASNYRWAREICGEDALVVGTEERPLGTALLARMYEEWAEPDLVLERGLILWPLWPGRMSHDEYLRRGLTFHDV